MDNIQSLQEIIKDINLESAIKGIAMMMSFQGIDDNGDTETVLEKTGLSSPYRQYSYLINMLLARETDGEKEWDNDIKKDVHNILEKITLDYTKPFLTMDPVEIDKMSEEEKVKNQTVMSFFLDYFNTADLRYVEQIFSKITKLFSYYNESIKNEFQNTCEELIEIAKYIECILQNNIDECNKCVKQLKDIIEPTLKRISDGVSIEQIRAENKELTERIDQNTRNVFNVRVKQLVDKFGTERVEGFLNNFSVYISSSDFRYYTEYNAFLDRPIVYKPDSEYFIVPIVKQLSVAMEENLYRYCNDKFGGRFTRKRDKLAEDRTLNSLKSLFGNEAQYFSSVFETNDSQNEHDLVVIYNNICIICEVKAKRVKEPFRDIDKAYTRIKRDFNSASGIQHAYNQALRLKKLIMSKDETTLFDSKGKTMTVINKQDIKKIYCLCVTDDNFSILASNLSLLLTKEPDEPYPLALSIDNLELIIDALKELGLSKNDFIKYIEQRSVYHEKLYSSDELGIAGLFIKHKGLNNILKINELDYVMVPTDASEIFDRIYYKKLGYEVNVEARNTYMDNRTKKTSKKKSSKSKLHKNKKIKKMARKSRKRNRK